MQSIDNAPIRDFCRLGNNILAAKVAFLVAGSYYESAPDVAFSGGSGTGAAGTAIVEDGVVTGVTITAAGTGYTSNPTVTIGGVTSGGGAGATGTAVRSGTTVQSVTITNGGGKTIKFTDLTDYDADDARAVVNISLFDHFGGQKEVQIDDSPDNQTTNVFPLNPNEGINAIVTVRSVNGNTKDGSIYDLVTQKTSGYFNIEA